MPDLNDVPDSPDSPAPNPFALMGDQNAVRVALECAKRWNLKSRVCHPLDRPSPARLAPELARFDAQVDAEDNRHYDG